MAPPDSARVLALEPSQGRPPLHMIGHVRAFVMLAPNVEVAAVHVFCDARTAIVLLDAGTSNVL